MMSVRICTQDVHSAIKIKTAVGVQLTKSAFRRIQRDQGVRQLPQKVVEILAMSLSLVLNVLPPMNVDGVQVGMLIN